MNTQSVSSILGLTQKELANLLAVSRSHVSMFESGRRNLPLHATQMLGELLSHAQEAKKLNRAAVQAKQQHAFRNQQITNLLQENSYQLQIVEKKIAAAERKVTAHQNLSHLANHLSQVTAKGAAQAHHNFLVTKSARVTPIDAGGMLVRLQLKCELLDVEKKYLESQLKK